MNNSRKRKNKFNTNLTDNKSPLLSFKFKKDLDLFDALENIILEIDEVSCLENPYYRKTITDKNKILESLALYRVFIWNELKKEGSEINKLFIRIKKILVTGNSILIVSNKESQYCHGTIVLSALNWFWKN